MGVQTVEMFDLLAISSKYILYDFFTARTLVNKHTFMHLLVLFLHCLVFLLSGMCLQIFTPSLIKV